MDANLENILIKRKLKRRDTHTHARPCSEKYNFSLSNKFVINSGKLIIDIVLFIENWCESVNVGRRQNCLENNIHIALTMDKMFQLKIVFSSKMERYVGRLLHRNV